MYDNSNESILGQYRYVMVITRESPDDTTSALAAYLIEAHWLESPHHCHGLVTYKGRDPN